MYRDIIMKRALKLDSSVYSYYKIKNLTFVCCIYSLHAYNIVSVSFQ